MLDEPELSVDVGLALAATPTPGANAEGGESQEGDFPSPGALAAAPGQAVPRVGMRTLMMTRVLNAMAPRVLAGREASRRDAL